MTLIVRPSHISAAFTASAWPLGALTKQSTWAVAFPVKSWQDARMSRVGKCARSFLETGKEKRIQQVYISPSRIRQSQLRGLYIYNYPVKKNLFKRQENCPSSMRGSAQTGPPKGTCKRKVWNTTNPSSGLVEPCHFLGVPSKCFSWKLGTPKFQLCIITFLPEQRQWFWGILYSWGKPMSHVWLYIYIYIITHTYLYIMYIYLYIYIHIIDPTISS